MFRSITSKLFVFSVVAASAFLAGMLLLQSYFFEDYYVSKKALAVEQYAEEIATAYSGTSDRFGIDIANLVNKYSQNYGLEIFYSEIFSNPANGDSVAPDTDPSAADSPAAGLSTIVTSGKFNSYSFIQMNTDFYIEQLNAGAHLYQNNKVQMDAGKSISYNATDSYGNTSVITLKSILVQGNPTGLLFVMSPLQPVGEAAGVIRDYYWIFFLAALAVIFALSLLFSRQVSKPLIHLNKIATGIAKLDFSQECTLKSKDELGNLSGTINKMSQNLKSTINKLKVTNVQLADEIKKQMETEHMRKLFVAGVSHELKTPISVVRGYAEGILDCFEKGEMKKEYAEVILNEAEKMERIISDMLDLSQMEAGKYRLHIEPFSIGRIIRYELNKFAPIIEKNCLNLSVDLQDEQITMLGDSLRIEQVLSNLINNAVRYTPPGGNIGIRVITENKLVRFEIENDCQGITKDELNRIWEDFYRIEQSRSRDLGGTGLGLSVVKSILQLHNSRFGVKETESGVLFYFSLKLSISDI